MGLQAPFPIAFGAGKLSGTNRSRRIKQGKSRRGIRPARAAQKLALALRPFFPIISAGPHLTFAPFCHGRDDQHTNSPVVSRLFQVEGAHHCPVVVPDAG
jgi:hypothetical protein